MKNDAAMTEGRRLPSKAILYLVIITTKIQLFYNTTHNSSNPSGNYFQHAVDKNEILTAVPSKKYRNSVKMSNIF